MIVFCNVEQARAVNPLSILFQNRRRKSSPGHLASAWNLQRPPALESRWRGLTAHVGSERLTISQDTNPSLSRIYLAIPSASKLDRELSPVKLDRELSPVKLTVNWVGNSPRRNWSNQLNLERFPGRLLWKDPKQWNFGAINFEEEKLHISGWWLYATLNFIGLGLIVHMFPR